MSEPNPAPAAVEGPRLLIVTPTLGESLFLDDAMQSVERLGLPVLHVLSCPEAAMIALKSRYPRTTVVRDAGREGSIYGALNAALAAAATEAWDWFTYINDDDLLSPGFAEMFREHVARAQPEPVTYGKVRLIDDRSRQLSWITVERTPRYLPSLLHTGISPLNQQGMLFHRTVVDALGGFRLQYKLCADLDFWVRAHAGGFAFRYYDCEVGQFRIRPGQLSGDVSATKREQEAVVAESFPARAPAWKLALLRLRYRLANLRSYLFRWRTVGLKTSDRLLGSGGAR